MLDQLLRWLWQRLETAGADRKPPVGPGIPDPDHVDLHRPRAALRRDLGHHGNADAGGNHLPDRVEIIEPGAKPHAGAEPCGVAGDMGVQRARGDQADEIALHHLAKIDLPPVRQFVLARGDQDQAVFAEGYPLDAVGQRVFGGEPEIGRAGDDGVRDVAAFALLDVDRDVRDAG